MWNRTTSLQLKMFRALFSQWTHKRFNCIDTFPDRPRSKFYVYFYILTCNILILQFHATAQSSQVELNVNHMTELAPAEDDPEETPPQYLPSFKIEVTKPQVSLFYYLYKGDRGYSICWMGTIFFLRYKIKNYCSKLNFKNFNFREITFKVCARTVISCIFEIWKCDNFGLEQYFQFRKALLIVGTLLYPPAPVRFSNSRNGNGVECFPLSLHHQIWHAYLIFASMNPII